MSVYVAVASYGMSRNDSFDVWLHVTRATARSALSADPKPTTTEIVPRASSGVVSSNAYVLCVGSSAGSRRSPSNVTPLMASSPSLASASCCGAAW